MTTGALLRATLFDKLERLPSLPGDRCKRLFPYAPRPRRRDDAHAQHTLGGAQEVHPAGNRPPTIACFFEELEALEPFLLGKRRHIGVEPAPGDLESEQRQPVFEPVERNEVSVPGHRLRAAEVPLGAEQAERIETRNNDLTFRPDHAIHFAQQLMRLVSEFKGMRKD